MHYPAKITDEQRQALDAHQNEPVAVEDDRTQKVYFIVPEKLHERAMRALREQQDLDAIREGIEQMEAGLGQPIEQADVELREALGFPPRQ